MTPERLYEMYTQERAGVFIVSLDWVDLDNADRQVWITFCRRPAGLWIGGRRMMLKLKWEHLQYPDRDRCVDATGRIVGRVEQDRYSYLPGEWRGFCELSVMGLGSIGNFTTQEAAKRAVEAEVRRLSKKPQRVTRSKA